MFIEHTHRQNQLKKYQHQHHARCSHYQQSIRMMLVSASVYCWYLQHPARVASFRSSEHGDGLDDIDVQIIAQMANGIESGQTDDILIDQC